MDFKALINSKMLSLNFIPQVGVGGLVVCYTICGAIAFQALETTDEKDDLIEKVEEDEKAVTDLDTR